MPDNEIKYDWVVGRYKGETAKYISALADAGVGYIRLDSPSGRGTNFEVTVAFRLPQDDAPDVNLMLVRDKSKIKYYESVWEKRHGIKHEENTEKTIAIEDIMEYNKGAKQERAINEED